MRRVVPEPKACPFRRYLLLELARRLCMAGPLARAFHGAGSLSVILVLYSPVIARIAPELCMLDGPLERPWGCTTLFWKPSRPLSRLFGRARPQPKWMAQRVVCFRKGSWPAFSRIRPGMV